MRNYISVLLKITITLLFSLFVFSSGNCQSNRVITIEYQEGRDGDLVFHCMNRGNCGYYLRIEFTQLSGLRANRVLPFESNVTTGQNRLFKLVPNPNSGRPFFNYKYSFFRGQVDPKINHQVNYLLPVSHGKKSTIIKISNLKAFLGQPVEEDFYALGFRMETGDTVFASRRGIVCSYVDDQVLLGENFLYSDKNNYVEIYHEDGTIGRYSPFAAGKIMVKPGQKIEAGDPLGIIDSESYHSGPMLRLAVIYLKKEHIEFGTGRNKATYSTCKLRFITNEGKDLVLIPQKTYTSVHSQEAITQEMSKREIRRWVKSQLKY